MGRLSRSLLTGRRLLPAAFCRVSAAAGFAALFLATTSPAAGAPVPGPGSPLPQAVQASTPAGLTLAVDGLEPRWTAAAAAPDGSPRFHLTIDGYPGAGAPGTPIVPTASSWLVVPPGLRPQVRVLAETWQAVDGRRLAFASQPVVMPGDGAQDPVLREMVLEPDTALPPGAVALRDFAGADKGHAGAAVVVDETTWWRGRRVAALRLVPVRWDPDGSVRQTLAAGRWEIAFVPDIVAKAALPAANARLTSGANDVRFAASFLNGELLGALPTEGVAAGIEPDADAGELLPRAGATATLLGPEARLAVTRTGPVRVSYARLRQRGLIPDVPIQESQVRLYQRRYLSRLDTGQGAPYAEVEVPIHMVGAGDAFDGEDYFVFHGLRLRDDAGYLGDVGGGPETIPGSGDPYEMNNEANLYWLACATPGTGQSWARMATTAIAPTVGAPLANFRHQGHYEEQSAFRENLPATTVDRMYANLHTDTEASLAVAPFLASGPGGRGRGRQREPDGVEQLRQPGDSAGSTDPAGPGGGHLQRDAAGSHRYQDLQRDHPELQRAGVGAGRVDGEGDDVDGHRRGQLPVRVPQLDPGRLRRAVPGRRQRTAFPRRRRGRLAAHRGDGLHQRRHRAARGDQPARARVRDAPGGQRGGRRRHLEAVGDARAVRHAPRVPRRRRLRRGGRARVQLPAVQRGRRPGRPDRDGGRRAGRHRRHAPGVPGRAGPLGPAPRGALGRHAAAARGGRGRPLRLVQRRPARSLGHQALQQPCADALGIVGAGGGRRRQRERAGQARADAGPGLGGATGCRRTTTRSAR
jgi:hypothetical protein